MGYSNSKIRKKSKRDRNKYIKKEIALFTADNISIRKLHKLIILAKKLSENSNRSEGFRRHYKKKFIDLRIVKLICSFEEKKKNWYNDVNKILPDIDEFELEIIKLLSKKIEMVILIEINTNEFLKNIKLYFQYLRNLHLTRNRDEIKELIEKGSNIIFNLHSTARILEFPIDRLINCLNKASNEIIGITAQVIEQNLMENFLPFM